MSDTQPSRIEALLPESDGGDFPDLDALNAEERKMLGQQLFVHGLLISLHDLAGDERQRRLNSALDALRKEDQPILRLLFGRSLRRVAAMLALVFGIGLVLLGVERERSTEFEVVAAKTFAGAPVPVVEGGADGRELFFSDAHVVMAPGSLAALAEAGALLEIRRGLVSIEGSLRASMGEREMQFVDGLFLIDADSQSLTVVSGAGQVLGVADPLAASYATLPYWAANGRAIDVFRELQDLVGDEVELDQNAWLATLRPMLAEPVPRALVTDLISCLRTAGYEAGDLQRDLAILDKLLRARLETSTRRGEDYERRLENSLQTFREWSEAATEVEIESRRKQLQRTLQWWNGLEDKQRERLAALILQRIAKKRDTPPIESQD